MLEVQNISFSVKEKLVLKDVSFFIPRSSIFGLLGPNGTGKSTLIKIILGVLPPSGGSVYFDNLKFLNQNRIEILRKVGSLIEHASLYGFLSALENLEIARRIYGTEKGYSEELLSLVGLQTNSNQKVHSFSVGMKQRLGIALAMIGKPDLVVLDEPTNGLDPKGLVDFTNLILRFNEINKTTFLISSHHLSELKKIATHFAVLNQGVSSKTFELKGDDVMEMEKVYFELIEK